MASTLVKRIGNAGLLTEEEEAAILLEKGWSEEVDLKLRIAPTIAYAQEVAAGRLPESSMYGWLTVAEFADAAKMIKDIKDGVYTFSEVERIFVLLESGVVSAQYVEAALGL